MSRRSSRVQDRVADVRRVAGSSASLPDEALLETARSLHIDVVTAEVASALREEGIRSIVLKGPSIHRLLYRDGAPRPYCDSDVLVAPDHLGAAGAALRTLGFERVTKGEAPHWAHEQRWARRRDGTRLELHWTVVGVEAEPAELWRTFTASTETVVVGGTEIEVLDPAAIAFQVALHAAQHGPARSQSISDLERALDQLGEPTWRAAAALADALQATETFAAGLRLLPAGATLAANLGLDTRKSVQIAVFSSAAPPMTAGLVQLARTRGTWRKLSLMARELVPSRFVIQRWWPPARRGGLWLLAAYVRRPFWLLVRLGPALLAWRRAVRGARETG
jgi:hypothetical protein